jgi:hypothetical protein
MEAGQRVWAFDKFDWIFAGRKEEDRSKFWKPATVVKIHEAHHKVPITATITWDHGGPRNTSHGHRLENLKPIS